MIAVIMSYYVGRLERERVLVLKYILQLSRSNSSVKATRVLVNRLIRLTIETGSLTGECVSITSKVEYNSASL